MLNPIIPVFHINVLISRYVFFIKVYKIISALNLNDKGKNVSDCFKECRKYNGNDCFAWSLNVVLRSYAIDDDLMEFCDHMSLKMI